MTKRKLNTNEEAFLLSTFSEFVKLWRSRKNSRLFIESVNGSAFISFSAFLGYPKNVRWTQSSQSQRNPKKKSSRKIQRDNNRAANFQERKRQEEAAATAARGNPHAPITSSSPITSSASSVTPAPVNFSFAPPVDEQLQSPETLRQQSQDRSSLLASFNNEEPIAGKSDMAATYQNDSQSLPTLGEADVSPRMDISSSGEPPTVTVTHWSEEFTRLVVTGNRFIGVPLAFHGLCNCCATTYLSRCYFRKGSQRKRSVNGILFLLLHISDSVSV